MEEQINGKYDKVAKRIKKDDRKELELRLRTGMWGYRTVKQKLDENVTREEMLNLRSKKNRDKFCW